MIYLFEDKEGRMALFMKERIDSSLLTRAVMNCRKDEISDYIGSHFNDADAILFHVSYAFPQSGVTNEAVREAFLAQGVPFVFFSGASKNSIGKTSQGVFFADVRSEDMYSNLSVFVEEFQKTGKVNIPLLVFGKNYLMNTLLKVMDWVNNQLWENDENAPINPLKTQIVASGISSIMREDELKNDLADMISFISEHRIKGDLTPNILLKQLQVIMDRH